MSKIQEALNRIQRPGKSAGPSASGGVLDSSEAATFLGKPTPEVNDQGVVIEPDDGGLIAIDREALRAEGYLAPQQQERHIADQYRIIKRPLIENALGKTAADLSEANLIMVTSALPGDGKTFNCINLALSMAREKDLTVLLVDADVAKPHVSELFNVADRPGMIDILNGQASFESVVMRTDLPRLSLLPAGSPDASATELLASRRMEGFVHDLSRSSPNRIVIFDSPPLLATSEARVLATHIGQIAMIVRAGKTPQRAVQDALNGLDKSKAINLILNESSSGVGSEGYGFYGYGYGYGHGNREPVTDS